MGLKSFIYQLINKCLTFLTLFQLQALCPIITPEVSYNPEKLSLAEVTFFWEGLYMDEFQRRMRFWGLMLNILEADTLWLMKSRGPPSSYMCCMFMKRASWDNFYTSQCTCLQSTYVPSYQSWFAVRNGKKSPN